jgi:hypothetical protein
VAGGPQRAAKAQSPAHGNWARLGKANNPRVTILPHASRSAIGPTRTSDESGHGGTAVKNCSLRKLPSMTRSRHRAEAFQIEAQAGPGSGIPPAKMSQRVSLSDGEGLLPSLCSDEPRAERTDQRVRQRSTHRVRDFVFARFAERPVFARPNLWCMIFIIANVTGSSSKQRLVRGPRR